MDIKAILAKVAKGEVLTDEEKAELAAYDPDKVSNSAAAAARKKAEQELKAAKDRVAELEAEAADKSNEGKTELEKATKQLEKLTKALADKDALIAKGEADRKKSLRDGKISKLMSGIKLMDGVDTDLVRMGLDRALADIGDDDLDSETVYKPVLAGFTAKNKALIVGDSGGGAGSPPKPGAGGGQGSNDPMKMSPEERQADLKKKGII
jgi:hypothetical protein